MHKWNLLKKAAPCVLSMAVAATSFPAAAFAAEDFDVVAVSDESTVSDEAAEGTAEDASEESTDTMEAGDLDPEAEDIDTGDVSEDVAQEETAPAEETENVVSQQSADDFTEAVEEFSEEPVEAVDTFSDEAEELQGEYQYVYAGLTWAQYWAAEGVSEAGNTTHSDELDSHSEYDKGAFDTVTRATANHGLHRGSFQCNASIITKSGNSYAISYWKDANTIVLTNGDEAGWNRGTITVNGNQEKMDHYEVYGLKYVPVAVKTADYGEFCKQFSVVKDGETLSGGYGENKLQSYTGLVADVNAATNGLKYAEKSGDSFTFSARKSDGTGSGIKDQELKTATGLEPAVKEATGSYGEFLRVDFNGNYGDLGANMQAVKWEYYGDDSTYTNRLASYGTKFAADNWMHKAMGIQLGLTDSIRCQLPKGTDGTGYWKLTIYALGYNDYTYTFQATDANIVKPSAEPADTTELTKAVEAAKALKESDYTAESWAAMQMELSEAEDILAKENVTQAEADEALTHLNAAVAALVQAPKAADTTALTKAISDAKALNSGDYTTDSWNKLQSAIKEADETAASGTTDQAVVDKAQADVTDAVSSLVKATIQLDKTTAALYKGNTVTLKATKNDAKATVTFKSDNTTVVTVDANGKVTAKAAGTARITASYGNVSATCTVTVKNPTVKATLTASTIYVKGTTSKATVKVSATGVTGTAKYTSSNTGVATVDAKGVVTARKAGTARITVTYGNGSATCTVTVKNAALKLSASTKTIYTKGTPSTVTVKAAKTGVTGTVKYTSSNAKVATVNAAGKVTAKKAGTVTITAKCGSLTATYNITVKKPVLTLKTKAAVSIKKGKTTTIKTAATPKATVTYRSSDARIAKVNSKGVVTGVKKGKATITVTANGVSKKVVVTVK